MSSTQEVGDIFGQGKGPATAMLRSPTVLIVSVGLWGMNIFFFNLFGINYRYVLNYDLMMEEQQQQQQQQQIQNATTISNTTSQHQLQPPESQAPPALPQAPISQGGMSKASSLGAPFGTSTPTTGETGEEEDAMKPNADSGANPTDTKAAEYATGGEITWIKLVAFSLILLVLLQLTRYIWMDKFHKGVIGAVVSFYAVMVAYIFLPISSNQWLRRGFVIVLQRSFELINPRCWCIQLNAASTYSNELQNPRPHNQTTLPRAIPFVDVFYADAMCSLSKVFFDWGMLLHMASHYPDPVPKDMHNILIPSMCATIPFLIRARQCMVMHSLGRLTQDPKRYQHLANAIKYSTSIWPLCLSAYQKTVDPEVAEGLEGYLILLLTINALYALYWDIVMDWGMMQNPTAVVQHACVGGYPPVDKGLPTARRGTAKCHDAILRPRLRFGLTLSTLILLADAGLRFSWLLRFVNFPGNHDAFVLCTQFLEVFRRALWNLLRVEWENIKQKTKQHKARDSLSDYEDNYTHDEDIGHDDTLPKSIVIPKNPKPAKEQELVGLLGTNTAPTPTKAVTSTSTTAVSHREGPSGMVKKPVAQVLHSIPPSENFKEM